MVLVDNAALAAIKARVEHAGGELKYGGIADNTIPPNIWPNVYLN